MIDISLIIVNYNVKEYLANLLSSVKRSQGNYSIETFVVDNASVDGSIPYLKKEFPDVKFIVNKTNRGFGKANNQALMQASGKYTLLINPDTIISEDTLDVMYSHMEANPNTALAGCKLLNPDGSFAPESRRQVPTPSIALWKALGLTSLFPKSRRFAGYYMNWLDEDEPSKVPVLSGSFMFCRTDVLKLMGGFDEDFFMYGEDIDLCYRVSKEGYDIDYVPQTSIIHYKGESTRKGGLDYHIIFNKSNYLFFRKHFSFGYSLLFRLTVLTGVVAHTAFNYTKSLLSRSMEMLTGLALLNILILILFLLRYQIHPADIFSDYETNYLVVNGIFTLIYLALSNYFESYSKRRHEILPLLKASIGSFAFIALITFFWRNFAFSRLILVWGAVLSPLLLVFVRYFFNSKRHSGSRLSGSVKAVRVLLVGTDENTPRLIRKIRSKVDWNYEIVGIVTQNESDLDTSIENIPVIGQLPFHTGMLDYYKINQVFFLVPALDYKDILKALSNLRNPDIITKLIPDSMDYIIGKTNVEYMDDLPVMDLQIEYQRPWNRIMKRQFDFWTSLAGVLLMTPFMIWKLPFIQNKLTLINLENANMDSSEIRLVKPVSANRFTNLYLLLWNVLKGNISLTGAPLADLSERDFIRYKPGITGLRQINEHRVFHEAEKERFELYYLQNYSVWLDLEIVFKTIFSGFSPLEYISKLNETEPKDDAPVS